MFELDLNPGYPNFPSGFRDKVLNYLLAHNLPRVTFAQEEILTISKAVELPCMVVETTLKAIGHWHLWNDSGDIFDGDEAEQKVIELFRGPSDKLENWILGVRVGTLDSILKK